MNDGGPAYPVEHIPGYVSASKGMSLRDYFAGQALTGIKANPELCRICSNAASDAGGKQQDYIARMAYTDAEAMLAERNKSSP